MGNDDQWCYSLFYLQFKVKKSNQSYLDGVRKYSSFKNIASYGWTGFFLALSVLSMISLCTLDFFWFVQCLHLILLLLLHMMIVPRGIANILLRRVETPWNYRRCTARECILQLLLLHLRLLLRDNLLLVQYVLMKATWLPRLELYLEHRFFSNSQSLAINAESSGS